MATPYYNIHEVNMVTLINHCQQNRPELSQSIDPYKRKFNINMY